MPVITGKFETENASKYLQQLCKHFAHKVEVKYDAFQGEVSFPSGRGFLKAEPDKLTMRMEVNNAEDIPRARSVIDKHMERFAFREHYVTADWDEPAAS